MARLHDLALGLSALALALSGPASAQQQQAAAGGAAIAGFRTVQLGMTADAAKAAMTRLGGAVVEAGNSVKVDRILRTEVGGVDGGKARLWIDIWQGKVVNITVNRQYDPLKQDDCKAKFDEKAKEISAQYGAFDQPSRWQDSFELWVAAARTRARITRDGKALDLVGNYTAGAAPPGEAFSNKHIAYCNISVAMSDLAWDQERRASGRNL